MPQPDGAHETMHLRAHTKSVYVHRYGCPECGHGVRRLVIDVDGAPNAELTGEVAKLLWRIIDDAAIAVDVRARGRLW